MRHKRTKRKMILVDTNIFIEFYRNNSVICEILEKAELLTLNKKDFVFIPKLKLYGMV